MKNRVLKNNKKKDLLQVASNQSFYYTDPQLHYLFFELTDKCNLNCLHCGSSCTNENHTFLPKDEIIGVLKDVKENSDYNPLICLTGGEPLLHPDFFEIIKEIDALGFNWGLTSNGTLFTKEAVKKMLDCHMYSVSISLDGNKQQHDYLRNVTNSYEAAINGINNLVELAKGKTIIEITTVISKLNINNLEEIYQLACKLNVDCFKPINIEPIGRANQTNLLLDRQDFIKLFYFIVSKKNEKKLDINYGCSHYLPIKYEHEVRDFYFHCGAGLFVGSVAANGDILACLDIERLDSLVQGNIYKDSFIDCWKNRYNIFRQDKTKQSEKCSHCKERKICLGDSTHTWDFINTNPKLCLYKLLKGE